MKSYESWGRIPRVTHSVQELFWRDDIHIVRNGTSFLPYGQGRSYGDACLNDGGTILSTEHLDKLISFDTVNGILRCEAGATLDQLLEVIVPKGWFLPVTPGTKFVSIGGAIANDVHGKNHHRAGTFGRHVLRFELRRSDGEVIECSPTEHSELYRATIGGLGLTGLITWAEIKLKKVQNPFIDMESIKFGGLDEFFEVSHSSDKDFEYTVAWLDCVSGGSSFGRGIFMRGNHSSKEGSALPKDKKPGTKSVPFDAPGFLLNPLTVRAFNTCYYHKQFSKVVKKTTHYEPFFYPLDSVLHWNRIYGKRGLFQFQCVVPSADNESAIRAVLRAIVDFGAASFLAVLKEFGDLTSPGMLSFPRKGVTLCLDFANEGEKTARFLMSLDALVRERGGAMYPAKDALMTPESFQDYYPQWREFASYIDPAFSSSFWRRVSKEASQ